MKSNNNIIIVSVDKIHIEVLEKAAAEGKIPPATILINNCLTDLYKQIILDPPVFGYDMEGRPQVYEIFCESYIPTISFNGFISYILPLHEKFYEIKDFLETNTSIYFEDYVIDTVNVCASKILNKDTAIDLDKAKHLCELLKQKMDPLKEFLENNNKRSHDK